ncbi:unnamed protein product [Chrysoparadoxa australica]
MKSPWTPSGSFRGGDVWGEKVSEEQLAATSYQVSSDRGQVLGPLSIKKRVLNIRLVNEQKEVGEREEDIAAALMSAAKGLFATFLTEDGSGVDYARLARSDEFGSYCKLSEQLALLEHSTIDSWDVSQKKAFWLNIYNSLLIHAVALWGEPAWVGSRLFLFSCASYRIGGMDLSLNEIEHGILRGNKKVPSPMGKPPFREGSDRLNLSLPLDPRVHMAMNCGARGCPPIRFYRGEAVEKQLDMACRGFNHGLEIDEEGFLMLSQIYQWYIDDFGGDAKSVLKFIQGHVSMATHQEAVAKQLALLNPKLRFQKYDWNLNSTSKTTRTPSFRSLSLKSMSGI